MTTVLTRIAAGILHFIEESLVKFRNDDNEKKFD